MRPNESDADWLEPDEPPSSTNNVVLPAYAGVYCIDAQGEQGVPHPSLIAAIAEPPMSPEAEVRGAGGCLAEASPDAIAWVLTNLGKDRIAREARGIVPARPREMTDDREEFAESYARDAREEFGQ